MVISNIFSIGLFPLLSLERPSFVCGCQQTKIYIWQPYGLTERLASIVYGRLPYELFVKGINVLCNCINEFSFSSLRVHNTCTFHHIFLLKLQPFSSFHSLFHKLMFTTVHHGTIVKYSSLRNLITSSLIGLQDWHALLN